ncbi:MAG: DapH/DapD/GlmU-related protein [Pseudomonadota bacterium]
MILAKTLRLDEGAKIGHLTVINRLERVHLARFATIGRSNRVYGRHSGQYPHSPGRVSSLILEDNAAITCNHILDCSDTIRLGAFSLVAGWATQILTHSPDFERGVQTTKPVHIGAYSFIGSRSVILMGTRVPDKSIVAAGSVFGPLREEDLSPYTLFSGTPAAAVRTLDEDWAFFKRDVGRLP